MRTILVVLSTILIVSGCSSGESSNPDGSVDDGSGQDGDQSTFPDPVPDECVTDVSAGEHQFECAGDLVFDVSVPEACLSEACGLVVDIHGYTMSGEMEDLNTNMRELGRQHGYVVVQPNAPGVVPETSWSASDDAGVLDFIQRIIAAHHLDPDRVHIMGFSQGGHMSWRTICAHSELFASASPGGVGAYVAEIETCQDHYSGCQFEGNQIPEHQLDLMMLIGTTDVFVDIQCARAQRDAIIAAWEMGEPEQVAGDEHYTWTRYVNSQGTVLEYLEHDYEDVAGIIDGHCYPGSSDLVPSIEGQLISYGCQEGCAFHWGEVAMDFFRAHPKND